MFCQQIANQRNQLHQKQVTDIPCTNIIFSPCTLHMTLQILSCIVILHSITIKSRFNFDCCPRTHVTLLMTFEFSNKQTHYSDRVICVSTYKFVSFYQQATFTGNFSMLLQNMTILCLLSNERDTFQYMKGTCHFIKFCPQRC